MNNRTFFLDEFHGLVFGPERPFNKDFLKEWNNIACVTNRRHNDKWTPIGWAAIYGYLDIVKFLVENDADITLNNNFTIKNAIYHNRLDIVKYLLSTNIYAEEYIQHVKFAYNPDIKKLLANYKQFSNTKACR